MLLNDVSLRFILIGNREISLHMLNDLDIVIVIPDHLSKFTCMIEWSPIVAELIDKYQIWIGVFPVLKSEYESGSSMFLQNVKSKGKQF